VSNEVFLCSICNINSGTCNEDCKFCSQSVRYKADIKRYKQKPIEDIKQEALQAQANKALGFCLVTSDKGLNDKTVEFVCSVAKEVKKIAPNLRLIGCNGTASIEQLKELKKVGILSYNHNLETSKQFYPNICSTHSWEERFQTCENVKKVALNLCVGGIFGLGESEKDRESLLKTIKQLNPRSIPLNFYIPNKNLPIKQTLITKSEALFWIKKYRDSFKDSIIMLAGGRELLFGEKWIKGIKAGANSIVIGNYLTTKGEKVSKDLKILTKYNYKIGKVCNG